MAQLKAIFVTVQPVRHSPLKHKEDFSAAHRLTQSADGQMFDRGCQRAPCQNPPAPLLRAYKRKPVGRAGSDSTGEKYF